MVNALETDPLTVTHPPIGQVAEFLTQEVLDVEFKNSAVEILGFKLDLESLPKDTEISDFEEYCSKIATAL